ncbi:stem cell self-renewal protein Piwi [Massarina eburnea CBS 473.64]|uniref:Stem cell self-renewal protein Piwi n=1 Tax=Massarina eburnea CBS 473.64 TaxID=1395130 RepID=A0A6A6SAU6_9PLEO|nr:stem cell self-renewal protein Piwi [Massarina eburnea CBS 473.64]
MNSCTLVLLGSTDLSQYADVRRQADLYSGVHTVCAQARTVERFDAQTLSNIALKINPKVGGINHILSSKAFDSYLGGNSRKNMIVLGADVGHPGAGVKAGHPSIACVVGSVDAYHVNYRGSMRLQAGGQEVTEHMESMVEERIRAWKAAASNANNDLTSMLFYRDGVSESQFQACLDHEIPAIKAAFKKVFPEASKELNLTFVIVGKRHHTRFYATSSATSYVTRDNKKGNYINGNLKPGLLVQKIVTNKSPYNFFLQSHCAIKGTARSAHYHVLEDGMKIKDLPNLTMLLCCAFSRATKGVSYVAPAYVADRLCERGRVYLRRWNNEIDAKPLFKLPDGKISKDELMDFKKVFAKELAGTEDVWGPNYNDGNRANKPLRLNPWHPNLDAGTFWM